MALAKQVIDVPLVAGLDTKSDSRAMNPPSLAVCRNAQFDEHGGIQTRKPYAEILDDSGNTIADIRKLAVYGDELVAFSKDKLWSYASGDGLWTERAEYLAVKVDENSRFVTTGEQYDCDRAELDGVTMYSWTEDTPSGTASYVAAIDTATGAVKMSPTALGTTTPTRLRLTASTNKIFLTHLDGTTLWVYAYDPADITGSYSSSSVALSGAVAYDVIVPATFPTTLIVAVSRATLYSVLLYDESAVLGVQVNPARTADGAISVAWDANSGNRMCVTRSNGTAIESDILDNNLADVNVGVSTGTASSSTVNQIASAYDGASVCRLFWSAGEVTTAASFVTETNTVGNSGVAGTEAYLVVRCGVSSRAFLHDGGVYVWVVFSAVSQGDIVAQLQNSFFLYRSDGLLVAKAVPSHAGGFAASEGALPSVQSLPGGQWAWCGIRRRAVAFGQDQKGYSAKSPQEIKFEFDSNDARRSAKLGETLYVAGGQISQFDGVNISEVGFHVFPWELSILAAVGTSLSAGSYNWKSTYRWDNARGEIDRSTTATITSQEIAATNQADLSHINLHVTAKTGGAGEVAQEFWRQVVDAPLSAPFYLVSSKDPAVTGVDNEYVENDPLATASPWFYDDMSDADLILKETNYENGGRTLENLPPPVASIIEATQDRIILAGIPGEPHRVVYSKLRGQGEIAAFHDGLYLDLPPDGGPITALGFLNETLIVFKESAIYALPGDGYDNNQGGQNYGPARLLHSDVGAESAEAVGLTSKGLLFKSRKGWFLLNHGWSALYIGGPVVDFDGDTVLAVHAMDAQHQVRCLTNNRVLVWDYLVNPEMGGAWSEWDIAGGLSAVLFGNTYHYTDGAKVFSEQAAWDMRNGPLATLDGNHGIGSSSIGANEDLSDWPTIGSILMSRGLAAEEYQHYNTLSDRFGLDWDGLANAHVIGASIELTHLAYLDGAVSAGARAITADASLWFLGTTEFPSNGVLAISPGLSEEEKISYSKASDTVFTTAALANSHLDGAEIVLVCAEDMGLDLETGWIKFAGLQGFQRIRRFFILGEYLGSHDLRVRVAYDYEEDENGPVWTNDKTWTVSPTTINGPLQVKVGPSKQKCQAVKIRITAQAEGLTLAPWTEALKLTGLSFWLGVKRTAYQGLGVAQKQ